MEKSLIYDYLAPKKLQPYRKELQNEKCEFTKWISEGREALEKSLNKEQLNLVDDYISYLNLQQGYVDYQVGIRTLNYGIKIGAQLQNVLSADNDYISDLVVYE